MPLCGRASANRLLRRLPAIGQCPPRVNMTGRWLGPGFRAATIMSWREVAKAPAEHSLGAHGAASRRELVRAFPSGRQNCPERAHLRLVLPERVLWAREEPSDRYDVRTAAPNQLRGYGN